MTTLIFVICVICTAIILILIFARLFRSLYLFGAISVIGGILFSSYFYFQEPVMIEDYQVAEIKYQRIFFKKSADKIIIVSNGKEYGLSRSVLKFYGKTDFKDIMKQLSLTYKAKVWLDDRNFIKGIESETFNMPPEIGVAYDNKTARGSVEIGFIFIVLGLIILFILPINNHLERWAGKKNSRIGI